MPSSASMYCSSSPVPSVATTRACVSPRVNRAEPWVRGRTPTSATIGRTVLRSRPSMRMPVSRMFQRTTLASASLNTSPMCCLSSAALGAFAGQQRAGDLGLGGVDRLVALLLAGDACRRRAGRPRRARGSRFSRAEWSGGLEVARLLGGLLGQLDDRVDHRLEAAWPNMTAPSMTSSESSLASDSTISTASAVPATTRSSVDCRSSRRRSG